MLIVMLTLAAILSAVLFGSLIPQGLPPEIYLDRYGEGLGRPFLALGLHDIFHTKGFALLGVILFVQLAICTGKRVSLLRGGFKTWVVGSVLLHIGLVVFLVSVGLSLWLGKTMMVEAPEGKVVSLQSQGFSFDLRLEKFEIDYYPDRSAVRQYRSEVTILRSGADVKRGRLEVNEPMSFENTKIFQMSYGWLLEGIVRRLPDGKTENFSVRNGDWVKAPGNGKEQIRIVLMADPDKHWATKPESAFLILGDDGTRRTGSVAMGAAKASDTIEVRFDRLRRYSGFQLKDDPAINGVFAGLTLALAGLLLRYVPIGGSKG